MMILCLAVTGCGQRGSNPTKPDNQANHSDGETWTDEEGIIHGTVTIGPEDDTSSDAEPDDSSTPTNPSDSSGLYTYELHGGITISCKTNVWDYIDGDSFDFRAMAHDLGFVNDGSDRPQCVTFSYGDDSSKIVVYFGDGTSPDDVFSYVAADYFENHELLHNQMVYFNRSDAKYQTNEKGPHYPFDAIVLAAYTMEQLENDAQATVYADVFSDYLSKEGTKYQEYKLP